jgi:hypothetical protein
MDTVLALICKNEHRNHRSPLEFATQLNLAVNGRGDVFFHRGEASCSFESDVDVDDVRRMLGQVGRRRKHALAFIERQPAKRVTRAQKRVFQRCIDFDGSVRE